MRARHIRSTIGPIGGSLLAVGTALGMAVAARAEPPAAQAVRNQLLDYSRTFAADQQSAVRAAFHGNSPANDAACDRDAAYTWRSEQAVQAVRDKWGAAAAAKFAHVIGIDTAEDDRAATIVVHGDHAVVTYAVPTVRKDHLVSVDGKWLLDESADRADLAGDKQPADVEYPTDAMRQVADDVKADKYDDVDDLIDDVGDKLGVDTPGSTPPPAPPPPAHHSSHRH